MNKALEEYEQTDTEISEALALVIVNNNIQATIPKSMVLDPEWFNRDQTKFEDWQREIRLYFKSNRVIETDDRITAILVYIRRDIVGIYAQKKLNKLDKKLDIQDQVNFVKEIKIIFSDKTKVADAKWKTKSFKQKKKNIANFIIKFKVLAMKVNTDKLHTIFLLKKNV